MSPHATPTPRSSSEWVLKWERPLRLRQEALQLIHDLSIHTENYAIIKGLAMALEDQPLEDVPILLHSIYEEAIREDPDAERVLLCLLCEYEISQLIGERRWQQMLEETLHQGYLNVWQLMTDFPRLFNRSARMLAELIPCLMQVIRGFATELKLSRSPLGMLHLLKHLYNTCQADGFESLKRIRIQPYALAELFLQGDNVGIIRKVYAQLGKRLQEQGFDRLDDGSYQLDTMKTLWAPVRIIHDTEDLAPPDELLHEMLSDSAVEDAREQTKHLMTGERIALAKKGDQKWLQFLIYDREPEVLKHVLANPRLRDHQIILLTNRRSTTPELLRVIAANKKWSAMYPIKLALTRNPNTPPEISIPLLPDLTQQDLLEITRLPELSPEIRRRARIALAKKVRGLPYSSRVALAAQTNIRLILDVLITDPDGNVVKSALNNPLMKKEDVLMLAGREKTPEIVLWAIAQNEKWVQDPSVYSALRENPTTPLIVHKHLQDQAKVFYS